MYFACDFETTGLLKPSAAPLEKQPHIVQFGVILFDSQWREISWHCELVKPTVKIPEEAINVHHITDEMVETAFPFAAHVDALLDMQKGRIWVGHNTPFDQGVLYHEARRVKRKFIPGPSLDLMTYCEAKWGKRRKLTDIHQDLFGCPFEGAHDALNDLRATVKCLHRLREEMEDAHVRA